MPQIVALAIEGALASSLALPLEMLRAGAQHARAHMRSPSALAVCMAGTDCNTPTLSGGIRVQPDCPLEAVASADLVLMPSLWRNPAATVARHTAVAGWLRRVARTGARICSVGTGSYFPAAAGLLDGCAATTHWSFFADFAHRHPRAPLQRRQLVTRAGAFYCAASVNSAADLTLHFVSEFFGAAAARQVEGQFSPEIRRPLAPSGFGSPGAGAHPDETIRMAQDWMLANPGSALHMPELAARCGLATRTFNRRFRLATGTTPLAFMRQARLNLARDLLRQSNLAIGEIAHRCGYPDAAYFSRSFTAATGSTPQQYRARTRGKLFQAVRYVARTSLPAPHPRS